jgi:GNAT superfamily N-acetyltransferase
VTLTIRRATVDDAQAVGEVWLRSFASAYTFALAHSEDEVRRWVREDLIPDHETWLAEDERGVIGLLTREAGWVDQLYIDPAAQGEGIGRRLLELAMTREPTGELQLWTFQVNDRARRFYARNGFVEVELTEGAGNEERQPDVRLVWRQEPATG